MNPHTIAAPEARVKNPISTDEIKKLPKLEDFKIAGMTPFYSGDGDELIAQAVSLLTLLTDAFETASDIGSEVIVRDEIVSDNRLTSLPPGIIARALNGVNTLICLGQHFEDVRYARQQGAQ